MPENRDPHLPPISNLQLREIQAKFAAPMLREFANILGYEKTAASAASAVQLDAEHAGRATAEKYRDNSLFVLERVVREVWAQDGALEYQLIELTDRTLRFDVHRCRYAELYAQLGIKEFGDCLSCCRDEPFTRGFNPRITLTRTQTIMAGAPLCDFCFVLE